LRPVGVITDPGTLEIGNDTTYEERVMLNIYYIHHWSPWLDLYLLAKTVKTVLFTKGAY
jgi:lipopolysaccharide/colanic/teichoic acid biosynthesis glycosyltransferase